ncbi:uncharacterized protein LOC141901764 [Tubulanus polymorphus]|uniref:uncharacterized protein LOC141901764 n=1 Tax=Tubulanus polymorphus TaxID=672921 RepID=UPI003DA3493F
MPIKKEELVFSELTPSTANAEIDNLVEKITETLRLKAKHKQRAFGQNNCSSSNSSRKSHSVHRTSPYSIPCKHHHHNGIRHSQDILNNSSSCHCHHPRHHHKTDCGGKSSEPYELLQELLREGTLIKEAVNRLISPGSPELVRKRSYYDDDLDI